MEVNNTKQQQAQEIIKASRDANVGTDEVKPQQFEIADKKTDEELALEQIVVEEAVDHYEEQLENKKHRTIEQFKQDMGQIVRVEEAHERASSSSATMALEDERKIQTEREVEEVQQKIREGLEKDQNIGQVKYHIKTSLAQAKAEGEAEQARASAGVVDPKLDEAMNKPVSDSSSDDTKLSVQDLEAKSKRQLIQFLLDRKVKGHGRLNDKNKEKLLEVLLTLMGRDKSELKYRNTNPEETAEAKAPRAPRTNKNVPVWVPKVKEKGVKSSSSSKR